jgi:hypothetical protein
MSGSSAVTGFLSSGGVCTQCGHPEDDHQMHGELPYPTDGWVTCPVAGCQCYGTWRLDETSRSAMEQARADHFRRVTGGEADPPAT